MAKVFHYRIRSHKDGVVSLSVKVPESQLNAFISFLSVKKRQVPSLSPEQMRERSERYFALLLKSASKEFDAVFKDLGDYRRTISVVRQSLSAKFPNMSYENTKFLLRRAGKLKGTRL